LYIGPIFEWKDWGKIPQKKGTSYNTERTCPPLQFSLVHSQYLTILREGTSVAQYILQY
jgi:hypothetical protein